MHRIDNIEDTTVSTTDIYKPKKAYQVNNEALFTDDYGSEDKDRSSNDEIHINPLVIVAVLVGIVGIGLLVYSFVIR